MGNTKKQLKQSEVELIWDERLKGEVRGGRIKLRVM